MTELADMDRRLADWFESEARSPAASDVLQFTLRVTRRRRPLPAVLAPWGSRWVGDIPGGVRGSNMSNRATIWVSAAAVLIVAVVVTYLYLGRPGGIGSPSSPSPLPTPSATPEIAIYLPHQNEDVIPPGRYQLSGPMSVQPPGWPARVNVTVPAGWRMTYTERGGGLHTAATEMLFTIGPEGAGLSGWSVANLYSDPCGERTLADRPLGPSVDDLVSGLASLPTVEVTQPTDTTLDGFDGKHLRMTVLSDCGDRGDGNGRLPIGLWTGTGEPKRGGEHFDQAGWLGWEHQLWILDVDGRRFVIDAAHAADASPELVTELQEMVASINIEP